MPRYSPPGETGPSVSRRRALMLGLSALAVRARPATAQGASPAAVMAGVALASPANVATDPVSGLLLARFSFDDPLPRRAPWRRRAPDDPALRQLAQWVARGRAAGNVGDLYDNRDRGHSRLAAPERPQLAFVVYDPVLAAAGIDYGLNWRLGFDAIAFGNSSTALTSGPFWRSHPRRAMTDPRLIAGLAMLNRTNQIYVYPEHRDHDPENGDLFPAAIPYLLVSQGSSGSDRPFLVALEAALAALKPDVKVWLAERGLIAPTLQMLLRRSMKGVVTDADYMSGAAHPSAFEGGAIQIDRLISRANALTRDAAPPAAGLRVIDEPDPQADLFGEGLSERLFDTHAAVARIARGPAFRRRYVLEAFAHGAEGRPVRFHWRALRGAARIEPLDPEGRRAVVEIDWQARVAVPDRPDLASSRADVGLFADNGAALSAPAFFSLAFPPGEARSYDPAGRPQVIDYGASAKGYADPALFPLLPWADRYAHDAGGRLLGWTRRRMKGAAGDAGGGETAFTRHGARVLTRDAQGRPLTAAVVTLELREGGPGGRAVVEEAETGAIATYAYAGEADLLGVASVTGP